MTALNGNGQKVTEYMYPRLQVSCLFYEFGSLLCSEVRVCGVVSPTGQRSRTRRPALLLVGVVGYFGCDYEGWCTRCSSDVRLPTLQWSRAMIQAWTLAGARSVQKAKVSIGERPALALLRAQSPSKVPHHCCAAVRFSLESGLWDFICLLVYLAEEASLFPLG